MNQASEMFGQRKRPPYPLLDHGGRRRGRDVMWDDTHDGQRPRVADKLDAPIVHQIWGRIFQQMVHRNSFLPLTSLVRDQVSKHSWTSKPWRLYGQAIRPIPPPYMRSSGSAGNSCRTAGSCLARHSQTQERCLKLDYDHEPGKSPGKSC